MQAIDAIDPHVQLVLWAERASLAAIWTYRERLVGWLTRSADEDMLLLQEQIDRLDAVLAERGVQAA